MIPLLLLLLQLSAGVKTPAPAECTIRGRITLRESAKPVPGVFITLVYTRYSEDGERETEPSGANESLSNETGEYELKGPRKGVYSVITGVWSTTGKLYVPSEVPIDEKSCNGELKTDIALTEGHKVTLQGKLIDGLGHRYPHWDWVWLQPRNTFDAAPLIGIPLGRNASFKDAPKDPEDYKIEGIPPGSYYLYSYRFDDVSTRDDTVIPFDVRDEDLHIDIISENALKVNGRIRFEGARFPLVGTYPPTNQPRLRVSLYTIGEPTEIPIPPASLQRDGTFGFSSVPEGKFRIAFSGLPEPFYIRSVKEGTIDVLKNGITVPTRVSSSLEVEVASDGGEIHGSVEKTTPAFASVVLVPEGTALLRSDLYKVAEVDGRGNFRIGGVAPGHYTIFAWRSEDISRRDYFNPRFVQRFQADGTRVEMPSHGKVSVSLKLLQ